MEPQGRKPWSLKKSVNPLLKEPLPIEKKKALFFKIKTLKDC